MKEKELKELKLTKNIIIPFPNFQQNTIISPTQMNDNFEEIEHAYNTLIDNHNGAITKVNKALSDITSTDNDVISNEQARVQAEETRVQNEEERVSNEEERVSEEQKRIAMYNTHLNDELKREQKHTEMVNTFDTKVSEVNTFVSTKKEEIDSFVDIKTEEVEEFVDLKTNQVNSFITTKTNEINAFVTAKGQEVQNAINAIPPKSELIGAKGDKGDKGDTPSITHLETSINNKINEVETRFNTLTSSQQQDAEVIDARTGENGKNYASLGDRLNEVDSQLEHKANKGDSITVSQIDKNKGKFDQTYMSDEFLQQMAGNTPIHSIPADNSITTDKLANNSVSIKKTDFAQFYTEYLDGYRITKNGDSDYTSDSFTTIAHEGMCVSNLIPIESIEGYWLFNKVSRISFFDENESFISSLYDGLNENQSFHCPTSAVNLVSDFPTLSTSKYIRVCLRIEDKDTASIRINNGSNLLYNKFVMPNLDIKGSQIGKNINDIENKTIDVKKISSIDVVNIPSRNLFNKQNTILGSWVKQHKQDGSNDTEIVFREDYKKSTGFISCEPNTIYVKTGVSHDGTVENCPPIFMFDENKQPISEIRTLGVFTTPSNARYMSGYLDDSSVNYREYPLGWHSDNYMIVKGSELPLKYEPFNNFAYFFDGLIVNASSITNIDKQFSPSILKDIECNESSINPFQVNTIDGYRFGYDYFGHMVEDSSYFISDFIPFDKTKVCNISTLGRLVFYNENKEGVSGWGNYSDTDLTVGCTIDIRQSDFEVKYVRVCLKKTLYNPDTFIMEQEGIPLVNIEKEYRFTDLKIGIDNLDEDVFSNIQGQIDDLNERIETSTIENSKTFKNHIDTKIIFEKNKDFNSTHFRIPFMCVTNLGTIIAGCDIRYNTWNDHSLIDIGTARSEDGGKTWIDKTVAIPNPGISSTLSRTMDGTILATREGRVFLIGNKFNDGSTGWTQVNTPNDPNWDIVLYHSDDDGRTWQFNQSLKHLLPQGQISFLGGVGSGIQMKNGTLVFPIQMARYNDTPFNCQSGFIYSTDNGVTWTMCNTLVPEYTSECSVIEYPTNTLIINCRQEGQNHRSIFKTTDLGTTWEATPMNSGTKQTNACQGHTLKIKTGFNDEVVLFTNPINDGTNRNDGAYSGYDRSNLSLSILQNDTKFTPIHTLYRPHSDGYSCMAFDERRNRLYVVMELEHNLVFRDLTSLLPTIQMYKNLESN